MYVSMLLFQMSRIIRINNCLFISIVLCCDFIRVVKKKIGCPANVKPSSATLIGLELGVTLPMITRAKRLLFAINCNYVANVANCMVWCQFQNAYFRRSSCAYSHHRMPVYTFAYSLHLYFTYSAYFLHIFCIFANFSADLGLK